VSSYDELTAIRADPGMRRQAQRLAGDLAEDLLQQTWYIVALASARKPIERLGGYFYRVMVNAAKRMREDVARHGIPVDDPVAAAGARGARELAAVSAEDAALGRLLADARRASLRCRRAELRLRIPASSQVPNRYRDVILAIAEAMLSADGPASRPEVNAALVEAYPEWFAAPDVATETRCQRRIRGREDVWRVLKAVLADGRPGQAALPDGRQHPAAA